MEFIWEWQKNCTLGNAGCSKLQVSVEGLGQAGFAKREKSGQRLDKFIGWRTGRDPWDMFAGEAISLSFLQVRHLWEISL